MQKNKAPYTQNKRSYRLFTSLLGVLLLSVLVIYFRCGISAAVLSFVYGAAAVLLLSLLVSTVSGAAESERKRSEELLLFSPVKEGCRRCASFFGKI